MPIRLGTVIAERTLKRAGSSRPVLARLGKPRGSRRAPWECPYQVVGGGSARVRVALGEDALQAVVLACAGLRAELARIQASWLGIGTSGIPPFLPDFLGAAFTAHLEAVVEREVVKFTAKLQRAHERKARHAGENAASGRRGLRAGR
jgi:hypothetical protein